MSEVFVKVYQDREGMDGRFYVDRLSNVEDSIKTWVSDASDGDLFPVIEITLMTEAEFLDLPEFEGY